MDYAFTSLLNDIAFAQNDCRTRFPNKVPDFSGLTPEQIKERGGFRNIEGLPLVDKPLHAHQIDSVEVFQQIWGSTALGFDGMGGNATTTANTILVTANGHCAVYFGSRFAYLVDCRDGDEWFIEARSKQGMPSVRRAKEFMEDTP